MCVPVDPNLVQAYAGNIIGGFSDMAQGKIGERIKRQESQSVLTSANAEAGRVRREGEAFMGQTRATQAASGVDIASGSPADVAAQSARGIEEDALNVIYAGRLKAYGKDLEADAFRRQRKGGQAQIFGTLLGGIVGGKAAKVAYGGY